MSHESDKHAKEGEEGSGRWVGRGKKRERKIIKNCFVLNANAQIQSRFPKAFRYLIKS